MKKRLPGFTVLIERALRLACVLSVAALAAACGGGEPEDDSADEASTISVDLSAGASARVPTTDGRSGGIVLSEKYTRPPPKGPGIVLSEKPRPGIVLSEAYAPNQIEQ